MLVSLCPNKDVCGSCSWSHLPYEKQLDQKIADINESFKLNGLDIRCSEIIPSPKTAHYRNRMDFVIDFEGRVGMRQKGAWWKVIDNHTCFLADENIDQLFPLVRQWAQTCGLSFYDRKSHKGLLRYVVIRSSSLGQTMVNIIVSNPCDKTEETKLLLALSDLSVLLDHSATTILYSINHTITDVSFAEDIHIVTGNGSIEERIGDLSYHISPNAFYQTNSTTAPLLLETVTAFCGESKNKTVLDLYCGTGFFSTALAGHAKSVIGVEL